MNPFEILSGGRRASLGLLLLLAIAPSASSQSVIAPNWIRSHGTEVATNERAPPLHGPRSWDSTPDGGAWLVTNDGYAYILRHLAQDDSVRTALRAPAQWNSAVSGSMIRAAPDGGAYALMGVGATCVLARIDSSHRFAWSRVLGESWTYRPACFDLVVLDDGVLWLGGSSMGRVGLDGTDRWTVRNGEAGRYFEGASFLVDRQAVVWVVGNGSVIGAPIPNQTSVMRFDLSGGRLGTDDFRCDACIASSATDIAELPDGRMVVVGAAGSGQPGFVAYYAPDGTRLARIVTPYQYGSVIVDAEGGVYARVRDSKTLHRLGPQGADVLWTVTGDAFIALAAGVLAAGTELAGTRYEQRFAAYAANGHARWATARPSVSEGTIGDGVVDAQGRVTLLAREPGDASCNAGPALLTFAADGELDRSRRACKGPGLTHARALDARAEVGALVDLRDALVARDASGVQLWRLAPCEARPGSLAGCIRHTPAILADDGGAWAVRSVIAANGYDLIAESLVRLGPDGRDVRLIALASTGADAQHIRLLAHGDGVLALVPRERALDWQRVDGEGKSLSGSIALWSNALVVRVLDAAIDPRGAFSVALTDTLSEVRITGCCSEYVSAMRIEPNGTETWRVEDDLWISATVGSDGDVYAILGTSPEPRIEHVRADGVRRVSPPVVGLAYPRKFDALRGPVGGRLVLADAYASVSTVRPDGTGLVTRAEHTTLLAADDTSLLVFSHRTGAPDAERLDAATLATTQAYAIPGERPSSYYDRGRWVLTDNGGVYGVRAVLEPDVYQRAHLARFAGTGELDTGRIFGDGFEQ